MGLVPGTGPEVLSQGGRDPVTPRAGCKVPPGGGWGHFHLLCPDGNDSPGCGRREFVGPVTHTRAGSQILPPPEGPGLPLPTGGVQALFRGILQEGQCPALGLQGCWLREGGCWAGGIGSPSRAERGRTWRETGGEEPEGLTEAGLAERRRG